MYIGWHNIPDVISQNQLSGTSIRGAKLKKVRY